jgi:polyphosphate kinase 2 (PPK2 family)
MNMKIKTEIFCVPAGKKVDLKKWPTRVKPIYDSKKDYHHALRNQVKKLSHLQRLHYASNRYAVLLIFQAMDAAGKDGAIRHVMSGVNPQGCQVFSFKHPNALELDHDFLWRTTRDLPERGRIGIFNRSYYEEVLIARVHPEILRNERLPERTGAKDKIWQGRYRSIVELEAHLQRKRFLKRIDDPEKNWKFSEADLAEREWWPDYMRAYEACLGATSTKDAPWHIVPADDKRNARLIVSEIILNVFKGLKMSYPKSDAKRRRELSSIRKRLER